MAHFIPSREGDFVNWLKNFSSKMKVMFATLGMSAELADGLQKLMDVFITDFSSANTARADSMKATANKDASKKACTDAILAIVATMKSNPLWVDAYSKEMQTDYLPVVIDRVNYKPSVTAVLDGGGVRLRINKYGAEAVNVYGKLPGGEFILLATVTRGVWVDKRPLGTPGIAEIRQYMVKGVMADEEVGHFSDIVTISFGG